MPGDSDRMAVPDGKAAFSLRSRSVARRLVRGEIYYALGRFAVARRAYSSLRVALEAIKGAPALPLAKTSVFPDVDGPATVAALRRDGVALGLKLPSELRDEILAYGETQRFIPLQGGAPLSRSDIRDGRLPDGAPAVVGRVLDPRQCAAVQRVAFDPALVAIAGAYLGYRPPIVLTELHWSFVSPATASYRRQLGQTIDYHYDVGWFNFLYFFFYITAVDARSGAHAIIRGSQRRKPPGMLFHSARQSDAAVLAEYGAASELVIEGEAGAGFVEDASAFHKALVPDARERLAFFVRYG